MIIIVLSRKRVRLLLGCVNGLTPDVEPPVDKLSLVLIDIGVLYDNSPCADARFTPS